MILITTQLLALSSLAFAQSTPTVTTTPSPILFPNLHGINARLKQDMEKMKVDFLSNQLTQTQLDTIKNQIKTVRIQELSFIKVNGLGVDLTTDQTAQLNQLLDAINP